MGAVLLLVFIVVPLAELWVIVAVGQGIGVLPTLALLLLVSIAGAALVGREGARAWRRFREVLDAGELPALEVVDGALLLLGGALMVTPGFLTDAVGLWLVLPPSRALTNRLVRSRARAFVGLGRPGPERRRAERPGGRPGEQVIEVEVVDIERDDDPARGRPPEVGKGPDRP